MDLPGTSAMDTTVSVDCTSGKLGKDYEVVTITSNNENTGFTKAASIKRIRESDSQASDQQRSGKR